MARAFIIVDLGFGDAGKGTVVDSLVRRTGAKLVVRYNGGSQASHNVCTDDGRHHAFSQYGSGSFVPETRTLLSQYVVFNPLTLLIEKAALEGAGVADLEKRLYVDIRALVTTPYHRALNRLREYARGPARHGSCGKGVGETVRDSIARGDAVIRAIDLISRTTLKDKLEMTRQSLLEEARRLSPKTKHLDRWGHELSTFDVDMTYLLDCYSRAVKQLQLVGPERVCELVHEETVIFEGAQGVLLDENFGFHPYTTWSSTTAKNAHLILQEAEHRGLAFKVGVSRTFMVRHGPGPFPTESDELQDLVDDDHNAMNEWQRQLRVGWLDLALLRYAANVSLAFDFLALTHLDKLERRDTWPVMTGYSMGPPLIPRSLEEQEALTSNLMRSTMCLETIPSKNVVETIEERMATKVGITSSGPTFLEKKYRGSVASLF